MFKPTTFGQASTTTGGFGAFGQQPQQNTMFGKPATTGGFGQTAFGATPQNTGLFGSPMSSGSLFGQPATTQTGFGFGASPAQPATNLFGATQPATNTGLFGSTNTFGQAKTGFGSTFGAAPTTGGMFGAQQTTSTSGGLFGATTGAVTPFGGGAFGAAANTQPGTVIKFNPVTGQDTLQKGTTSQPIQTRHMCISAMKEYEAKSLEELRCEDYAANRKGPQQGSTGLFGQTAAQPSMFGATTGGLFGASTTENKGLFGATSTPALGGTFGSGGGMFGAQPAASNSLFGAKPTGFGTTTTTATTGFGGFGTTTSSGGGLFGSSTPAFGASAAGGTMFGQTSAAATQPTTGFGTNTSFGSAFGQQPGTNMGLFGQNKPATTGFGLTSQPSTGFGFGQTSTAGTSLFGAKPATTGFGATSAFGTTGTTFGTTTTGSSLFNKPATSSFSFGAATGGLGGNTLGTQGTSLFGSAQPKPGGLFGTTPSTGMFGGSTAFGAPTTGFGATNTGLGGSTLGGTSSFFGSSLSAPAAPAASTAAPVHSAILALACMPFAESPLYKSLLPQAKKTDANAANMTNNAMTQKARTTDLKVSPKADTKVKVKPLMTSQIKKSLFDGLDDFQSSSSVSSVRTLKLKPRVFNASLNESSSDTTSQREGRPAAFNQSLNESVADAVSNKENRRVSFSFPLETPQREKDSETFYIRRNPLFKPPSSNVLSPSTLDDTVPAASSTFAEPVSPSRREDSPATSRSPDSASISRTSRQTATPDSTAKSPGEKSLDGSGDHTNKSFDETIGFLNVTSELATEWMPHPTGITMRRTDYYIIPSLDDLALLVADDGACIVDNLCIGRRGYGNLFYDCTMDVADLDIDSIVHFRHKEVNVYPDESQKPPVGEGLNRKCQVTLEQVFPVQKDTREMITDPEELAQLRYEEKLRRSTAKMKASFVEYRPHTGSWVFKVDHFSKYGLSDSEDEETLPAKLPARMPLKPTKPAITSPTSGLPLKAAGQLTSPISGLPMESTPMLKTPGHAPMKMPSSSILSPISPPKQQCFSLTDGHSMTSAATFVVPHNDKSVEEDMDMIEDEQVDVTDVLDSPWGQPVAGAKIDAHRVQLMKSSLFHAADDVKDDLQELEELSYSRRLSPSVTSGGAKRRSAALPLFTADSYDMGVSNVSNNISQLSVSRELPSLPPIPIPRPKTVSLRITDRALPYGKSTMAVAGSRSLADSGLMKGRSFRAGWGPCSRLNALADADNMNDTQLQQINVFPSDDDAFKDSIEKHLEIELKLVTRGEEDGCPVLSATPGVQALHQHCLLSAEMAHADDKYLTYCHHAWALCSALWGDLPVLSIHDDVTSHKAMMIRKEAVTEWLRHCAAPAVAQEAGDRKDLRAVFSHLTANSLATACQLSQTKGGHYTALMMCSGQQGKLMIQQQLNEWVDVAADNFIDKQRLAVYTVAAGLPAIDISCDVLNVCTGLDWKRVFALHFWYMSSPVASIPDVVAKYEAAFTGEAPYADAPHPPYCEDVRTAAGKAIYDLCFHLLKLFTCKSHPLEALLNPSTHTADPLDCRLSWLIGQTLSAVGYNHISPLCASVLDVSFAAQLEAHGMWHWAIFVLLHIADSARRQQAVKDMLSRHVELLEDRDLTPEEDFVVTELHVAREWVFAAKAVGATYRRCYDDAAHYRLRAQEWNDAHRVIVDHLAPDLVINENYEYLEELLSQLAPHGQQIAEWPQQGELLLDFLDIRRSVSRALEEQDAGQLEARLPQLASVCDRVVRWPTHTVKHRLCQAEIAKGAGHIYLNVKRFDSSQSSLRDARQLIMRLPMPEDYRREELEFVTQAESALSSASSMS